MTIPPRAVLFACTQNAVRSPMAAALARDLLGPGVQVESAGLRAGEPDPLAAAALAEIGIELVHSPRRFEDVADSAFDLVVILSPEAQAGAAELTRRAATVVEYWPTPDPTGFEGSREQRLAGYRAVRDGLAARLKRRFG